MRTSLAFAVTVGFAAVLMPGAAFAQACAAPKPMTFQIDSQFRRDIRGFTQGLEVRGDSLFESTGSQVGDTRLTTIDPKTGKVTVLANFGKRFFGEGLTILNNQIYQLSWQEHLAFVYDLNGKLLRSMRNMFEGWGLTNDGANLIFTDGSDQLRYVSPTDFKILRSVPVKLGNAPLASLNELENVGGKIYANVFQTSDIVRIEPRTGCVEAVARLDRLVDRMSPEERRYLQSDFNFVLNGIAYDAPRKTFYVTGKNWITIFAGRFVDQQQR
jgi:glutaminyl-peptide cyclotransferase